MTHERGGTVDIDRPVRALVEFAQRLRLAGVAIGSDQVITFCRAVDWVGLGDLDDLYWAGRATLVTSGEHIPVYDTTFDSVFRGVERFGVERENPELAVISDSAPEGAGEQNSEDNAGGDRTALRASAVEHLRTMDFSRMSEAEHRIMESVVAQLRLTPPSRRSRRTESARRGRTPDLRRSIRLAMRTHGEMVTRSWRGPRTRPRRLVLLLDISGSMADYSRGLLLFAYALSHADTRVEVFCFGTRIARVTRPLRLRDPDAALADAAAEVMDWRGGTRIGASIDEFIQRWGRSALARQSMVLICSDGLERGEPTILAAHMERLARLAHTIIWVNPLKGDEQYQPLARGMAAALPHVDHFVAGHNLASLEELGRLLRDIA